MVVWPCLAHVFFLKCHVLPEPLLWSIILRPTWILVVDLRHAVYVSSPWPSQALTQQVMQTTYRPTKSSSSRICRVLCLLAAHWMVMRNWRCSVPGQSGLGQGRWEDPTKIHTPAGSKITLSRVRWRRHDSGKEDVTDNSLAKENSKLAGVMSSMQREVLCRRGFQVVWEEIVRGRVTWGEKETDHIFRVVTQKMQYIIWPKLLSAGDLPDVGYTFWLSYLWRWIIKEVAGHWLYFPVLQTQRHSGDQGNFSSLKFKGSFLLFVRKSQPLLVLTQLKVPTTFGWGAPFGITVLTVSEAMDVVAKGCSSFQATLLSVCGAHVKFIHAGHSLCQRKSKILETALGAGAQPSSLPGRGAAACLWCGGLFSSRRNSADREVGKQERDRLQKPTAVFTILPEFWYSHHMEIEVIPYIFWLPSLPSKLRGGHLLS